MRKLVLAILMLSSLSITAQQKKIVKKKPTTEEARMQRLTSFLKINGGKDTEAHFLSIAKANPGINLDMEKSLVSGAYAEDPNPTKVLQYVNSIEDPVFRLRALLMAVEVVAAIDNTKALELVTGKLEEAKKMKGKTALSVPLKMDPKTVYIDFINSYGKLLFKAGKNEEAYQYTSEAYQSIKNRDGELAENYAFLSSINGKYNEALPVLAKAVQGGKFEERYVEQVKIGYAKLNPGKDVDAYIKELKSVFITKIKEDVSKIIINKAAPNFTVSDVNGKKVSLADFKGKTIVLDFWATWCGPCVASFPAMQMAVNRYEKDPNIKFLFIHTAENVPDPLTDAKNFLSKRDYNLELYMDVNDPVTKTNPAAKAFEITGIPAKFIIDGNGRIRFSVLGFEGTTEAVAEEVVQMVEMARKGV